MSEAATWTDERVERLKKLWSEGFSASQIAAELGKVTRNAVIGKVHRLGLSGRAKTPASGSAPPRPRKPSPARPTPPSPANGPLLRGNLAVALQPLMDAAPAPVAQTGAGGDVVVPLSERVTIMELRENMCRWPLGDPTTAEFRYCGARRADATVPYCSYHCRMAYQPAAERRRDRDGDRRQSRA